MYCVHYVLFLISLCAYSGLCNRKPCFYDDIKCLVDLAKEKQPIIVDGVPGEIETSDPLHVNQVGGDLPEMTFKLKNITLRGLRDCHPVLAKIDLKKSLFDFSLDCDVLYVTKEYEIHGRKAGIPAEATGVNTVTMHDCSLEMNGELNLSTKFEITDFQVKTSVKGEVEIEHKNSVEATSLSQEDREQWKIIEELFRPVLMKSLLSKYYKNINDYIKLKPLDITFE